jgi:hypothetical protein
MRKIIIILALAIFIPVIACDAQNTKQPAITGSSKKVETYYFHFTARCITCRTVEVEAKQDIELLYPELVKQGMISFKAVNLDEPSSKSIAESLGVNGQTLLLVKGNQKINITNEGFMYARNDPEKFRAIIKEKVDSLLKL